MHSPSNGREDEIKGKEWKEQQFDKMSKIGAKGKEKYITLYK